MIQRDDDMGHPADAFEMLRADHRKVKALFHQYETATDPYTQGKIAEQAFTELALHAQLEEQVFYPAFELEADEAWKPVVAESLEDHQEVANLMDELRGLDPVDQAFHEMFLELRDIVEDHIDAEETAMFPVAKKVLAEHAADLRDEMQELKRNLLSS